MSDQLISYRVVGVGGEEELDKDNDFVNNVVLFRTVRSNTDPSCMDSLEESITYTIQNSPPDHCTDEIDVEIEASEENDVFTECEVEAAQESEKYEIISEYLLTTENRATDEVEANTIPTTDLTPESLRKKSKIASNKLYIVYHCSYCSLAFENFTSIKKHEAEHIEVGHTLLVNQNKQTTYLGMPLLPQSSQELKYICSYCHKGFTNSVDRRKHIKVTHEKKLKKKRIISSAAKEASVEDDTTPTMAIKTCDYCSQIFPNAETYNCHLRKHYHHTKIVLARVDQDKSC